MLLKSNFLLVFAVLTFVATVLLIEGLYLLWDTYRGPEAKKIERRLRALSAGARDAGQTSVLKEQMRSEIPLLARLLQAIPRMDALERLLLQSGLEWTVAMLLSMSALAWIGAFALLRFYLHAFGAAFEAAVALGPALAPLAFALWRRRVRLGRMERQLPDALDLLSRAMRAGHSFAAALKMVGEEMSEPIAREFAIAHDEINFGVPLQQALANLGQRVPLTDLRYFIVAVSIQRETGGNLTEVLSNLGSLIRGRLNLLARIRVLTAEGRISAWTLGLLPFALAALLQWGNPEFIGVLWTDPVGIEITRITLLLMAAGAFWLWRTTKIRV
ncbi:MAG TPA: type II secretion system F family protein [Burkholderiaceae bacterium]